MDSDKAAPAEVVLANQDKTVSDFQYNKLIKDYVRNWDLFYKRNTTNFFKDRHWTAQEFEELRPESKPPQSKRLLELGCGVGNFVFPLLDKNPELFIYACDLSKRAVDFVKVIASKHQWEYHARTRKEWKDSSPEQQQDPKYNPETCQAFVCNIVTDDLTETIPAQSLDIVSALFVLSAIPPDSLPQALTNIHKVLKPGGTLLFRDYGLNDAAQHRFKPTSKMSDRFYTRADGTFSYFFSTERVEEVLLSAGFELLENTYVCKEVVNRKRELSMERVFAQARARRI
ncbi:S-adenosyl-L-methionine-dependent methyltransferase [Phlyctochytrium arcticum]|nr:S-adenosyl-L-methionine-dependent methyltransferase [Phlyctochytrium arcticum]